MRNGNSLKGKVRIQKAVMEMMEQRMLFAAGPIALDPSFGTAGVTTQFAGSAGTEMLSAINPVNQEVYVVGVNGNTQTVAIPYNIEEYGNDGRIDTSFGAGGLAPGAVSGAVPLAQEQPVAAAAQSDGKLLVLSVNVPTYEVELFYLTRYTTAGAIDTTFGNNGTLTISSYYTAFSGSSATAFSILPDGNIAVLNSEITMFTSTGAVAAGFGTDGSAFGVPGVLTGVTTDASGNLLAYGVAENQATPPMQTTDIGGLIERFTPTGTLDKSFGNAGSIVAANVNGFDAVQVASTGIVAMGQDAAVTTPLLDLNHYTSAGLVDTSVGAGKGYVSLALGSTIDYADFQSNGDLDIFGSLNSNNDTAVAQLTASGSLDPAFGSGGYVDLGSDLDTGASLEPDGQVVALAPQASTFDFEPARLLASGAPDSGFGASGTAIGRQVYSTADSVFYEYNGDTLVAGQTNVGSQQGLYIERFLPNGALDYSFGAFTGFSAAANGSVFIPIPAGHTAAVVGLQADQEGNIYFAESGVGVSRYDRTGQLDHSFAFATQGIYADPQVDGIFLANNGQLLETSGTSTVTLLNVNGIASSFASLPTGFNQAGRALAEQPNGEFLVGGQVHDAAFESDLMAVVRLGAYGGVDTSFGTKGVAVADSLAEEDQYQTESSYSATPSSVAVLTNGTIVLAGTGGVTYKGGRDVGPTIAEFLTTGQLNPAFGTGGQTSAYVPDNQWQASADSLIVESDGTLVTAGTLYKGGLPYDSSDALVATYAADGTVESFVTGDFAPAEPSALYGPYTTFSQAVAGPDGTILAVGSLASDSTGSTGTVLARYIIPQTSLKGTVIGTSGSYQNQGNTIAKVFDGNVSTFFDAPTASGSYVGEDLGTAAVITQISFAPRAGFSGRMIGGVFQASNSATFASGTVNLYTIPSTPAGGVLTTEAVNNSTAYRYVRYVGPANSYCNIAELQFFGTAPSRAIIGTVGSYQNQGNTIANVFDNDLSTFFDAPTASGSWVGLDFETPKVITQISYSPRTGYSSRMVGGVFQASNSATFTSGDVTLLTVTTNPQSGTLTNVTINSVSAYRYLRYVGPANSYCNIAEMQVATAAAPGTTEIGTAGSYNNLGNTLSNAFDGNLSTFFDAPTASAAWVGLNYGTAVSISQVSFAPRAGYTGRMIGGEIQASNSASFSSGVVTAYTITAAPAAGVLTTVNLGSVGAYQYWRYIGPAGSYCNIAELDFVLS